MEISKRAIILEKTNYSVTGKREEKLIPLYIDDIVTITYNEGVTIKGGIVDFPSLKTLGEAKGITLNTSPIPYKASLLTVDLQGINDITVHSSVEESSDDEDEGDSTKSETTSPEGQEEPESFDTDIDWY